MRERVKREAGHPDLDTPFSNPTSLGDSTLAPSALGLLTSFSIIRSLRGTFKNFTPPCNIYAMVTARDFKFRILVGHLEYLPYND